MKAENMITMATRENMNCPLTLRAEKTPLSRHRQSAMNFFDNSSSRNSALSYAHANTTDEKHDRLRRTFRLRPLIAKSLIPTIGFGQISKAIMDAKEIRPFFESFGGLFVKTIFVENALPSFNLTTNVKKEQNRCIPTVAKFKDTFAKLKIYISRNFNDLKAAFIYYHCFDLIHYYVHYNEFLESFSNPGNYKEKLRNVEYIHLIEAYNEEFYFETVQFTQETVESNFEMWQRELSAFKAISRRKPKEAFSGRSNRNQTDLQTDLRMNNRQLYMTYILIRVQLLLQTLYHLKVTSFEVRFFINKSQVLIASINKLVLGKEAFTLEEPASECELDPFKSRDTNKSDRDYLAALLHKYRDDTDDMISPSSARKYHSLISKIENSRKQVLCKIPEKFDFTKMVDEESDRCFQLMMPESKVKLSKLIEFDPKYMCLEKHVEEQRRLYIQKIKLL
jgi:hypothetical protein